MNNIKIFKNKTLRKMKKCTIEIFEFSMNDNYIVTV